MHSRSTGEVNYVLATSKTNQTSDPCTRVRALTFEVTDNFGSNDLLPCGAYGPQSYLPTAREDLSTFISSGPLTACIR